MEWLSGKKTYIVSGLGVVVFGLYIFGVIDKDQAEMLGGLLGFTGIATIRAGIAKG